MKRRNFVQSLLAATAVSVAAPASIPARAADETGNGPKTEVKPEEYAYAPGTITGPLGRYSLCVAEFELLEA